MAENRSDHRSRLIAEEKYRRELAEKRAAWEREQRERKAQQDRQRKQGELESYLRRRGQAYLDHTGSPPPQHVLEGWQLEYLAQRDAEEQRQREAKLKAAEAEYPF